MTDPGESRTLRYEGETFTGRRVHVDDVEFLNCRFVDCDLIYEGGRFSLNGCSFEACRWHFTRAAANTLQLMAALYQMGGDARSLIETTFEHLRKGSTERSSKA